MFRGGTRCVSTATVVAEDNSDRFWLGTGTKAGDRTEATVWMDTFLRGRSTNLPLVVGSVKVNLGHTEPTAGLVGLLKAILVLERGIDPVTPTPKSLSPDVAAVLAYSLV
jgi:acyl transferase domain-containing protein